MPLSSSHHDLFHQSNAADKISLVQSLLQANDLNADEALALVKSIHEELAQPEGHDGSVYASYAHMMEALRHVLPETHQQMMATLQAPDKADAKDESADEPAEEEAEGSETEAKHTEKLEHESEKESEGEEEEGGEGEEEEEEPEEEEEE